VVLCLHLMVSKQGAAGAENESDSIQSALRNLYKCENFCIEHTLNLYGSIHPCNYFYFYSTPVSYNGTHEECTSYKSSNNWLSVNIHYEVFNFGFPWHSVAAS
jgi:hypothetical protein